MAPKQYRYLTPEQAEHFVQHGWLKIENCFTREQAEYATRDVWTRLDCSPTDKSTWVEKTGMPLHNRWRISEFAPKAWDVICDLVGDERLVATQNWGDNFIMNLGSPEGEGKDIPPDQWHTDNANTMHFLDSTEQGLLIMPLYSDIRPGGGGTIAIPDALPHLVRYLYEHPEGLTPGWKAPGEPPGMPNASLPRKLGRSMPRESHIEVTGKAGDVWFFHPLTLHSRVNNKNRDVRIVTNNKCKLKQPFNFDRADPSQYSLIERSTLKALGRESLPGWHATGEREKLAPREQKLEAGRQRKTLETARMAAARRQ